MIVLLATLKTPFSDVKCAAMGDQRERGFADGIFLINPGYAVARLIVGQGSYDIMLASAFPHLLVFYL
jgi:hypothetical protein